MSALEGIMENEYGDMDQVALDFCDWWCERTLRFLVEIDVNWRSIVILYEFEARECAKKWFGHDTFIAKR